MKNDETIVIVPGDKGKVTVVIDKDEYVKKCEEHLNDENTYKKLDLNPSKSFQNRINKKLKEIQESREISYN